MTRNFVDREEELRRLAEEYAKRGFRFVVVYGRRRVGKTELLKKFVENKDSLYFLCSLRGIDKNVERFSEKIGEKYGFSVKFSNFLDAFKFLKEREVDVVVIDEFPYLISLDSGIVSEFQEIIDEILKDSNIMLILCGSSIGMMERDVISYKSPLYGRATMIMKVKPFSLFEMLKWYNSVEDAIKIYGVTSGIPKYMEFFSGKNIEDEIILNFFRSDTFLYNEARLLLSEELRNIYTYFNILEAISVGKTKLSEIASYSGIEAKDLPFYLNVLMRLGIVGREYSITDRKRKRGIYKIEDEYFRFWFRFVSPYQEDIEMNYPENAIKDFRKNFNAYLGITFEKIVKDLLLRMNSLNLLPFRFEKIGRWWSREEEIDLVAINSRKKRALLIEVKYKELDEREKNRIMESLASKASLVKELKDYSVDFLVIDKNYFKKHTQVILNKLK